MTTSIDTTTELVLAYYERWQNPSAPFDEARLRLVLASELFFEGPIAGKRTGVESFLRGLADFARSLRAADGAGGAGWQRCGGAI